MVRLPDIGRLHRLLTVMLLISLSVMGDGYDPGDLSASDWREIRGWSSYARAQYLIAGHSTDVNQISDHLRDCLIALPESEIALRLLLFLQQGMRDISSLLEDLSAVAAENPEQARINVVYAECLADAGQTDAACRHLQEFIHRTGWSGPEPVIALLKIKADKGAWAEADDFLNKALRKKGLRGEPRLKIFQAYFLLRRANAEKCSPAQCALVRKKAQALLQPFLEKPESLHDWEFFISIFPVLVELENWKSMNRLLDEAPADFQQTTFWFKNKLLALVKLQDVEGLNRLSREVFAAPELNETVLEEIAIAYIDVKEISKATEIYEMLHLRNVHSLHYRLKLGWLYLLRRADSKGMALLAPIKELPFQGLLLKAEFLKRRQQLDKALEVYQQAEKLALASEETRYLDSTFYVTYALAAEKAGKQELTIEKFRKAHQIDPDNPNVCNGLGYTLADYNQDLQLAEQLIEKAVQAEPDNVAFLDSLAWARFRLKKFPEALEAMLKTLTVFQPRQDPDGVIHQHASEIFAANQYPVLTELFRYKATWEQMP